jgi:hypothetical protein
MKTFCSPNWIRTNGRRFRKPVLYPTELWDQFFEIAKVKKEII